MIVIINAHRFTNPMTMTHYAFILKLIISDIHAITNDIYTCRQNQLLVNSLNDAHLLDFAQFYFSIL